MPLFEYFCSACQKKFEQIVSSSDLDAGRCPGCGSQKARKLISRFAIGGQGDLRESTMHGCHDYDGSPGGDSHGGHEGHDHGHEGHSEGGSDSD